MAGTAASTERVDPWRLAHGSARDAGVSLRALDSISDTELVRGLVRKVWAKDLLPDVIRALAHSGNVPWGAFRGEEIVGFVLGWAGVDEGGLHIHSHMLATLPEHRGRGVGAALKFAQRAQALDQGIRHARWTFDPMVTRNAIFNLNRLGAIADHFHRGFYGEMNDALNLGQRSDRLVALWDLEREPGPRPFTGEVVAVPVGTERDPVASGIESALAAGNVAAGFDVPSSSYLFIQTGAIA